jgi:hypothetical protein
MINRNIIFIIAVFLYSGITASKAQVGIRAGIGVSDIIIDKDIQSQYLGYEDNLLDQSRPLVALSAGVFGNFRIFEALDLQPELFYLTQGTRLKSDFIYDNITYKISINYLHLPLLLNGKFLPGKKWHPRILAGPHISYKLKATKSIETNNIMKKEDFPTVKNYDLGIIGGMAFDFDLKKGQVIIDIRASYSLINTMDKMDASIPPYRSPDKDKARNTCITFSLGYRWGPFLYKNKQDYD